MIPVYPFNFLCFELWDNEIVQVKGTDYYQLRLRGYLKGKPAKPYETKQMGIKNGTAYALISGFSVCGRKEQLEYLKLYILKAIERSKTKVYNHIIADIPFLRGKLNVGYAFGRRSLYGYVFNFNFQRWIDQNDGKIDKVALKELDNEFEKIYDAYADEREMVDGIYQKHLKRVVDMKLQREWEKFNEMSEENIDGAIETFLNEISGKSVKEINEYIDAQKIKLEISDLD